MDHMHHGHFIRPSDWRCSITCVEQLRHRRQAPADSAYDPIGLSGIAFSALLALIALAVWLIWLQVF